MHRLAKSGAFAFILAFTAIVQFVVTEPIAGGANVCNQTVPVKKDIKIQQPVEYVIQYQSLCGLLPCTKTRKEVRVDSRIKSTVVETQVPRCCSGYAETADRQCAPICLNSCNNGKCVQPNVCKCNSEPTESSPGYVGSTCSRFVCLATDRWGSNCDRECSCPTNSYCSASTGKCLCRAGWRGTNCTEECDPFTNCEDFELPPIVDPEANVIHDSVMPARLVDSRALSREAELPEESVGPAQQAASFCYLYVILSAACCCLFILAMHYRLRLKEIRNELYASYSSTSTSSSGSSDYMPPPTYDGVSRPRMPTPPESDYLSKNLSFASATRNIILGKDSNFSQHNSKDSTLVGGFLLAPKVESHLMASKRNSEKNVYSDASNNHLQQQPQHTRGFSSVDINSDENNAHRFGKAKEEPAEDHDYQVPKSSTRRVYLDETTNEVSIANSGQYENDNSSNIYEEIKPRSFSSSTSNEDDKH